MHEFTFKINELVDLLEKLIDRMNGKINKNHIRSYEIMLGQIRNQIKMIDAIDDKTLEKHIDKQGLSGIEVSIDKLWYELLEHNPDFKLNEVDTLLKNPYLKMDQIDYLLDIRLTLMK